MLIRQNSSGAHKTKSSYIFRLYEGHNIVEVPFPAEYFCAPQFYYTDQEHFQSNPRQLQMYLAGRVLFPIPMELPRFTPEQTKYSAFLRDAVKIGDMFVNKETVQELVRQATAGSSVHRSISVSKKHIFHPDYVTEPEEAMRRFDSRFNKSFTQRSSMTRLLSHKLDSDLMASRVGSSDAPGPRSESPALSTGSKND